MPGERVGPPLLMALGEVAWICPVPVASWLASSGEGIQVIAAAHGDARLRSRWATTAPRPDGYLRCQIWLPTSAAPPPPEAAFAVYGTAALRERGGDRRTRPRAGGLLGR